MRVVTFNIQHGRTPAGRVDIDLLGRVCAEFGADVLALQEVDVRRPRSGWRHTVRDVAKATGMHAAYGPALRGYGNALFSTGPITEVRTHRLPRHGGNEPRVALLARTHGHSVAVTHLSIDDAEARGQLRAAVGLLCERPGPHLLVGDLNLTDPDVAPLRLVDPTTPSWPADAPRIRIDHAAVDPGREAAAQVLPAPPLSDHRPLRVEL